MDMIGRVARAICNATGEFPWDECQENYREEYRREARAAIEAMREPTEQMLVAGDEFDGGYAGGFNGSSGAHWRVMIDAALAKEP